jgi:hypothetical protein
MMSIEDARIRSELERSGKPIENMDLLIASHAVSQRMTLVTNNIKHSSNVPGLRCRHPSARGDVSAGQGRFCRASFVAPPERAQDRGDPQHPRATPYTSIHIPASDAT